MLGLAAAGGLALSAEPEGQRVSSHRAPIEAVFDLPRAADTDLLVLTSGAQQQGTIETEAVHLRTAHGPLQLPRDVLAGLELAAGPGELDRVVTVRSDLLQGLVEDDGFRMAALSNAPSLTIRREKVRRIVFRVRPGEADEAGQGWLVQLRSGSFFHGRLTAPRLRLVDSGVELAADADNLLALVFHSGESVDAQVHLGAGEVLRAAASSEELKFQADFGMTLRFYHDQVQEVRRVGALPERLARRLGVPLLRDPDPSREAAGPDPAVVPIEGMQWIAPGEFVMGSPTHEASRDLDEGPTTTVTIPQGFWLSDHEVTQAEYEALLKTNPSQYLGDLQRPVEKVNWQEALEYCRRLTELERAKGNLPADYAYRLPTEAEWEYACRAGTRTRYSFGDDPGRTLIQDYAWYGANSDSAPHPVRLKRANPWGLHDLHGNVLEWCLDEWQGSLPGGAVTNRIALPSGTLRVARGGSWLYEARFCRSANRDSYGLMNRCSDVGFRVALSRLAAEPH